MITVQTTGHSLIKVELTIDDVLILLGDRLSLCHPGFMDKELEKSKEYQEFFANLSYGEGSNRLYTICSMNDELTWNLSRIKKEKSEAEILCFLGFLTEWKKVKKN